MQLADDAIKAQVREGILVAFMRMSPGYNEVQCSRLPHIPLLRVYTQVLSLASFLQIALDRIPEKKECMQASSAAARRWQVNLTLPLLGRVKAVLQQCIADCRLSCALSE